MATDWANALNWGAGATFTAPTAFELARSAPQVDTYRSGAWVYLG